MKGLKARNVTARGEAPGSNVKSIQALKGRNKGPIKLVTSFQAWGNFAV